MNDEEFDNLIRAQAFFGRAIRFLCWLALAGLLVIIVRNLPACLS